MAEQKRSQNFVVLVVKDNDGNVLKLSDKNVEVVTIAKKFSLEMFNQIKDTEGAFMITV